MGEATSLNTTYYEKEMLRICGLVNSVFISVLTLRRLDERVTDTGRELQILGPWYDTRLNCHLIIHLFKTTELKCLNTRV